MLYVNIYMALANSVNVATTPSFFPCAAPEQTTMHALASIHNMHALPIAQAYSEYESQAGIPAQPSPSGASLGEDAEVTIRPWPDVGSERQGGRRQAHCKNQAPHKA